MSKDGLMFIHPTQNRSLTPREAARVQSFPDTFLFPVARTHQYRLIGNAVPPLLARVIGRAVITYLNRNDEKRPHKRIDPRYLPDSQEVAASFINNVVTQNTDISKLDSVAFKRLWFAVAYLFDGL